MHLNIIPLPCIISYYIVVNELRRNHQRQKRNIVEDPTDLIPLPGYTSARLNSSKVAIVFVIGIRECNNLCSLQNKISYVIINRFYK